MKLKYLLVIAFIIIAAGPLFLSLHFLNDYTAKQYRTQIENHLSALSQIAKKRVLAAVERVEDNAAQISTRHQLLLNLNIWNQQKNDDALKIVETILRDAQLELAKLYQVSIYSPQGELVISTSDTPLQNQISLSSKKHEIQIVQESSQILIESTDRLTLENRTIGFIKSSFKADFLVDLVNDRTGLGQSGEWAFAVRHASGDAIFAIPLKNDKDAAFTRRISKDRTDIPITQALLGNEIIMSNAPDYVGEPVLASTRYISELDWGLVVKISEQEVNATADATSEVIWYLEILIISLAAIVGIGLSFFISKPLEKLKNHTAEVAKGVFVEHPPTKGWFEVGELAKDFNAMVHAVKDLNDNLNHKVEERTAELNELNEQLTELSIRDPLTGLYNRRYLNDRLDEEISRSVRYCTDLCFVMIDVDHFKKVNDNWGHATGDAVLVGLADYLGKTLRKSDVLARLGGEEFCFVLPGCSENTSLTFLERIRSDISELEFFSDAGILQVTCSFGVSYLAHQSDDSDSLMRRADDALYIAKDKGRNRVERGLLEKTV